MCYLHFFSLYALSQSTCEPSAEAVAGLSMLQMNKYSQANTQHVSLRLCVGHASHDGNHHARPEKGVIKTF